MTHHLDHDHHVWTTQQAALRAVAALRLQQRAHTYRILAYGGVWARGLRRHEVLSAMRQLRNLGWGGQIPLYREPDLAEVEAIQRWRRGPLLAIGTVDELAPIRAALFEASDAREEREMYERRLDERAELAELLRVGFYRSQRSR